MQKDALHVLVVMGMSVAVVVISVLVRMSMAVVCVSEGCETHNVDEEAQNTDNQKFVQSLQLMAFPQAFESIEYYLHTDKPKWVSK